VKRLHKTSGVLIPLADEACGNGNSAVFESERESKIRCDPHDPAHEVAVQMDASLGSQSCPWYCTVIATRRNRAELKTWCKL